MDPDGEGVDQAAAAVPGRPRRAWLPAGEPINSHDGSPFLKRGAVRESTIVHHQGHGVEAAVLEDESPPGIPAALGPRPRARRAAGPARTRAVGSPPRSGRRRGAPGSTSWPPLSTPSPAPGFGRGVRHWRSGVIMRSVLAVAFEHRLAYRAQREARVALAAMQVPFETRDRRQIHRGPGVPVQRRREAPAASRRPGRPSRPPRRGRCLTAPPGGRCLPRDPPTARGRSRAGSSHRGRPSIAKRPDRSPAVSSGTLTQCSRAC